MSPRPPAGSPPRRAPSSAISASTRARSGPSPAIRTRRSGKSCSSAAAARIRTSRAFSGRRVHAVPITGAPSLIPSSALTSPPGRAGGRRDPERDEPDPVGIDPLQVDHRLAGLPETARNAAARVAITWRSRNCRSGSPSNDQLCSWAITTGVAAILPRMEAQRLEPNWWLWRMSTRSSRSSLTAAHQAHTPTREARRMPTIRTSASRSASTRGAIRGSSSSC